ncbi:MAG: hypothetical protein FD147_1196 [Chloroflexi bacterium]|nr:MAG: hypothetical protein FD147_1196 [Chloroflexota bacterium]MBA4375304.1 hypothetical protein [Anaerolinea sp.]
MISLHVMLFIFIILFAIIGAMRGWAKELLVMFSVILALFTMNVLESFVPFFKDTIKASLPGTVFWIRTAILSALVFFGYQTPKLQKLADSGRFVRNMLQDSLLGGFLGAVNGYLVFGTIWYYLNAAGYPFSFVLAPDPVTANGIAAINWINYLPPAWLMGTPAIYFAVVICFVFVLVVFI